MKYFKELKIMKPIKLYEPGLRKEAVVPMSIKMLKDIKYDVYNTYFGLKVDSIIIVAKITNIQLTRSKRQIKITLQDASGEKFIDVTYSVWGNRDPIEEIKQKTQTNDLKQLSYVKCILYMKSNSSEFGLKDIRKVDSFQELSDHIGMTIEFHCKLIYNLNSF